MWENQAMLQPHYTKQNVLGNLIFVILIILANSSNKKRENLKILEYLISQFHLQKP